MAIETDIYTPRTLGKLVRRLPPVRTFFLDTFFRNKRTFYTKSVVQFVQSGGGRFFESARGFDDRGILPDGFALRNLAHFLCNGEVARKNIFTRAIRP